MATLEQRLQYSLGVLSETVRRFGDKNTPITFTVDSTVFDIEAVIADNFGNTTLWQSGQGGMTVFKFLIFTCDTEVILELANTTPSPDERMLFRIAAGSTIVLSSQIMGAYASDTSRLDGSALVSGTDFNNITQIRVQRDQPTGSGAATIRMMLVAS